MSTLTLKERGDLAEEMLPVAANLAVLVHGDGGPEDVAEVLASLSEAQQRALIVVLAGLVDPEQSVGKALGWLNSGEDRAQALSDGRTLRELAPEPEDQGGYVDQVAVQRFVRGFRVGDLTDEEFLTAVKQCAAEGMSCADIDVLRRWPVKTTANWVNRVKKRYERSGREFPDLGLNKTPSFTEDQVLTIRRRAAAGTPDAEIAMSYDVTRETIRAVVTGQRYASYGGPIRTRRTAKSRKASREYMCGHADRSLAAGFWKAPVLTTEERASVRERTGAGEPVKELAAEYGVSMQTIRNYAA